MEATRTPDARARLTELRGHLENFVRDGSYARSIFWSAAGRFTPVLVARRPEAQFLVNTSDGDIGRRLFLRGELDDVELADRALAVLAEHGLPASELASKTLVEIGGNIGTASIALIRRGSFARAITFEPDADNLQLLRANVALNRCGDRIDVRGQAVSDRPGKLAFARSPLHQGGHRVQQRDPSVQTAFGEEGWHETEVDAVTIDELVAEGAISPSECGLIWMDVQGHEPAALAGAESLLAARIPVVCEYWPYGLALAQGLERFEALVQRHFSTYVHLRRDGARDRPAPVASIARLRDAYPAPDDFGDVVLLP